MVIPPQEIGTDRIFQSIRLILLLQIGQVWFGVIAKFQGGAVFMRDGTGNRNRQFEVAGIEPRLEIDHKLFNTKMN
jgi:hypothetical protein